jgi:protein-tyrosine phosphatase
LVDIHSHVLPGIDDGASDYETALAMCRMAAESGTRELVATPHSNVQYSYDPVAVQGLVGKLQADLGDQIFLHRGCDLHLTSDNIRAAIKDRSRFTINGHQYLLVEFSDEILLQGTAQVFQQLRDAGIVPIITHPERNQHLRKSHPRLAEWIHRGCLIQITAQSLLGRFGERALASAIAMMDGGLVHFIASDAHNLTGRTPKLMPAYEFVRYRWGEAMANKLLIDNPWAVLWGETIDVQKVAVSRRGRKRRKRVARISPA